MDSPPRPGYAGGRFSAEFLSLTEEGPVRTRLVVLALTLVVVTLAPGLAAALDDHVTVRLTNFARPEMAKDGAIALARTAFIDDGQGGLLADTNIWLFDNLRLRRLTESPGAGRLNFSLKISAGWVGWAEYLACAACDLGSQVDIMGYDRRHRVVRNVSNSQRSDDPFFDLADDTFAWKAVEADFSEYDVFVSNGRTVRKINEESNDDFPLLFTDVKTSHGNVAFSAGGTDPRDGSFDDEIFFFDGERLRQVTRDGPANPQSEGNRDGPPLVSGDKVVFFTSPPGVFDQPYRLRLYDGHTRQTRVVLQPGDLTVEGHPIGSDPGVFNFALPITYVHPYLYWNGTLADVGPQFLLTDVRDGRTWVLDELVGTQVLEGVGISEGLVAFHTFEPGNSQRVGLLNPATGRLQWLAQYAPGEGRSVNHLVSSGRSVAYELVDFTGNGNPTDVVVHYTLADYVRQLLGF